MSHRIATFFYPDVFISPIHSLIPIDGLKHNQPRDETGKVMLKEQTICPRNFAVGAI